MPKEKEMKVAFNIAKLSTKEFTTRDLEKPEGDNIQIQAGIKFGVNRESKLIGCFTTIEFLNDGESFIKLVTLCEFGINPESWENMKDENKTLVIPHNIALHFGTIAIGSTRGILHCKTEGTAFNKFFLPTINVTDIVLGDQSFPEESNPE